MPAIKRITNDSPEVEAKVNYFIDRYNHHVLYGGSEWQLELENQLSLIEKIHFQLTKDQNTAWFISITTSRTSSLTMMRNGWATLRRNGVVSFIIVSTGKTIVKIPTFETLHPLHAFPLSEMIRILTDETAIEICEELAELVKLPIIYYSREDIDEAYGWNEMEPRGKISGIPMKETVNIPKHDLQHGFNPKYRIVLSKERVASGLYVLS